MLSRYEFILNSFLTLACEIDIPVLERYISFCIERDIGKKKNKASSSHHILPAAQNLPFGRYRNLRENSWNKSELIYSDHYFAHYLLAKAVKHVSTISAFCAMHNQDVILSRLTEEDLISAEEFQQIYHYRNYLISKDRMQIVTDADGNLMTKAKLIHSSVDWSNARKLTSERTKGSGNPVHLPGVVEKIRERKRTLIVDGKNMDTIGAEKAAASMKKEFLKDGVLTTQYRENGKKLSETLKTTDLAKRRAATRKKKYYSGKECPMVIVKNAFDPSYSVVMSLNEARKISPGIDKKTKEDYLGKSKYAQTVFYRDSKEYLIGLYAERLSPVDPDHTLVRDQSQDP